MKKMIVSLLLTTCFIIGVFSSCGDLLDQDLDNDGQNLTLEMNDSIQTMSYCFGCLPSITASLYGYNDFVLAWSGNQSEMNDHEITLSCGVSGTDNISMILYSSSGSINVPVPSSDEYIVNWSLSCRSSGCTGCKESGSYLKKTTGELIKGSGTDCFKDYLGYTIDFRSDTGLEFNLIPSSEIYSNSGLMEINAGRMYQINNIGADIEILGGVSMVPSSDRSSIRCHISPQSAGKSIRVEFYNTNCANNYEHYYYLEYYFSLYDYISYDWSLRLVNLHKK